MSRIQDDPDICVVPLNPMGAIKLGKHPCNYCNSGWGNSYSQEGAQSTSCHDGCEYINMSQEDKNLLLLTTSR